METLASISKKFFSRPHLLKKLAYHCKSFVYCRSIAAWLEEFSLAVKIRLARHGSKKRPYYRVIVADSRAPRDGKFIEEVGRYNPCVSPSMIKLDLEKIDEWVANGAQPTDTVARLIKTARESA